MSSDLNPFDVQCPLCLRVVQSCDFPKHVREKHADRGAEAHRCPICFLETHTQPPKLPIAEHLQVTHGDCQPTDEPKYTLTYCEHVLEADLPEEVVTCPICWEDFKKGQNTLLFSCCCRFHKNCIDEWWRSHEDRRGDCTIHRRGEPPV